MSHSQSSDDDTLLAAIIDRIPGYGAYRSAEACREDDRKARQFVASRLEDCKGNLDRVGLAATEVIQLSVVAEVEKLRSAIQTQKSRIESAIEGYATWFGKRQLDESKLRQAIELDHGLVSLVDQIDQAVGDAAKDLEKWNSQPIAELVEQLSDRIDRRAKMLSD